MSQGYRKPPQTDHKAPKGTPSGPFHLARWRYAGAMAQPPSIGRIVHYTNLGDKDGKYPPQTIAAMITKLNDDDTVALKCFYPTGLFDLPSASYTEEPAGSEGARGKWTWPAR